jgi:PAS domain S-box-containing protein
VAGPRGRLGNAWDVVAAFMTGRLRARFYADLDLISNLPDAEVRVAAGYVCLAAAFCWALSLVMLLVANPTHVESIVAALLVSAACYAGFTRMRVGRNSKAIIDALLLVHLGAIAYLSYRHSGVVAPVVVCLPIIVGLVIMFQRKVMRWVSLGVSVAVAVFSLACASGIIGVPTSYGPQALAIVTFLIMAFTAAAVGGIAVIANMSRDYALTNLKNTNDTILENAARSRVALEAARVGLWDVPDLEAQKFHASESFQTVTGYSAEEFDAIWQGIDKFVHPDDVATLREAFAVARTRMSRLRVDFRLNTRTRGYRWFSARARYIFNDNGSIRISGSLQDINFIKLAEEALRKGRDQARAADKAKSDFIATMSHEVRTPLNAIMGAVEVLKRGAHDRETTELINLVDDAGSGLLAIVSDLLDVSKIDAGKLEISSGPTDIRSLVTRTADVWRPQAVDKGLALEVDCRNAEAPELLVDGGRIRQILGNLLSNAIKFTDSGSVRVLVSTHDQTDGRVEIVLSVIDSGPGVPDTVAETIFAPFEQSPGNASRGGTGLGLFISRRLARLMGGDLTLEPARRSGAHFRLSLTVDRAASEGGAALDPSADPVWAERQVLCVDDNEKNRRIVELLLRKFGMDVTLCASGGEALDICAMHRFDVILMDIVMPEMDGIETLRRLRSDPDGMNRATPTIALTAKLTNEDLVSYSAAGFAGVAGKPINVRELAQAIAPALRPLPKV